MYDYAKDDNGFHLKKAECPTWEKEHNAYWWVLIKRKEKKKANKEDK